MKSISMKPYCISIITGFLLVAALICIPVLAVGSGSSHPIEKFSDINDNGNVDIQMKTGKILVNDGSNHFLSNEIVMQNSVPMQRIYTLSNSTVVPIESYNTYIDLSYVAFLNNNENDAIIIVTPGNGTAMIFSEKSDGDFYPTKFISIKNQMDRNLIVNLNNQECTRRS